MMRQFYFVFILLLFSCNNPSGKEKIRSNFETGNFTIAQKLIKDYLQDENADPDLKKEYSLLSEQMNRIRIDFSKDREDVISYIKKYYPKVNDSMLQNWEEDRSLEYRMIDGKKKYFNRAASNLFLINEDAKNQKEKLVGEQVGGVEKFQQRYVPALFQKHVEERKPLDKRKIKINYSIALEVNAVPEGEVVKCWLPYPRPDKLRLNNIELLSTSEESYILAPEDQLQRSIYMEQTAVKDSVTAFHITYTADFAGIWHPVKPEDVGEYDKNTDLYKKFTSERAPHIVFSEEIKELSRNIVGKETNPVKQVELIYYWMNDNIPWSGALEYSIMPNIPAYVLENGRGDCGMQTFLFMSLARSLGIPTKWQSGWYLLPEEINLHDWAEVYYEGVGWVPVDPSFKLIDSEEKKIREFYMNGLDSYRLIINDDYAREFYPKKEFYRSEPFDFQRGEIEWKGGNLYFDKWTYHMDVTYF